MDIKKILAKFYYYLKKIYNYIHLNIFNINIKNKYNVTKIQKQHLINRECVFCLDSLTNNNSNYKCKFCSISFHDNCFKEYMEYSKKNKCLHCNR